MIKLWNWIVRFFQRRRLRREYKNTEDKDILGMYGTDEGLERRLAQLFAQYGHMNKDEPFEPIYRPGEAKASSLETTNEVLIFDNKSALPIARESTPVQKRVVELLKEKPVPPPKRHDEI